ncbi:MAG: ComEC/Rec2 family competence protein, partial [Deltaproteobacteria bacterium]
GVGWALGAIGVAWAGWIVRGRWGTTAALAMLLASFGAGLARRREVPGFVPRPRRTPDVARILGTVERGCVDRGEFTVCEVSTAARRIELHTPRAGCAAAPGDTIEALVTLRPVQPTLNGARDGPGAALVRRGIETIGESTRCEITGRAGGFVRVLRRGGHWLRGALGSGIARALGATGAARARALLFGDESGLASDDGDAFRQSGLAHLLAVSGAHVALLASGLGAMITALLRRWRRVAERGRIHALATWLPLAPVICFVVATGESASAMRALVAALCASVARLAGRRARAEPLVATSLIVTLGLEPSCAFDPGWQLSIVAAWALAASRNDRAERASLVCSVFAFFLESLRASARVAVAAAPVLAWQFQRVPLSALAANALAAPLAEAIGLPLVLATGLSAVLPRGAARALGHVTGVILEALFAMPHLALRLPGATAVVPTPTPTQCVVLTGAAIVGMRAAWRVRIALTLAAAVVVFAIEVPHARASHPRGVLRVTAIDVGQGDALLIDLPDGEAMLVDGGGGFSGFDPGARIVVPALADRRRRSLVAVVASHPHPDHIGGLPAVLAWASSVGSLWDTRQGEGFDDANGAYGAMRAMAASHGIPVLGP